MSEKGTPKVKRIKITDLQFDPHNANAGTARGAGMVEDSLRQVGAGRSILLDENWRIVAGNKTVEQAAQIGIEDVILVETDGNELVAVVRPGWNLLDQTGPARKAAYFDNRSSQMSLDWDLDQLLADREAGVDFSRMFSAMELDDLLLTAKGAPDLEELEDEYGDEPEGDEHHPVIRIKVNPEIHALYLALMEQAEGEDDGEKFSYILNLAQSAMGG